MARRAAIIQELRDKHSDLVVLDVGDVFSFSEEDEYFAKGQTMMEALSLAGYDAVNFADRDLLQDKTLAREFDRELSVDFIGSNIASRDEWPAPYKIIDSGAGERVGVLGVTGRARGVTTELLDPETALDPLVNKLREECDFLVLLSMLRYNETVDLMQHYPDIDVAFSDPYDPENSPHPKVFRFESRARYIETVEFKDGSWSKSQYRLGDSVAKDMGMIALLKRRGIKVSEESCGESDKKSARKPRGPAVRSEDSIEKMSAKEYLDYLKRE